MGCTFGIKACGKQRKKVGLGWEKANYCIGPTTTLVNAGRSLELDCMLLLLWVGPKSPGLYTNASVRMWVALKRVWLWEKQFSAAVIIQLTVEGCLPTSFPEARTVYRSLKGNLGGTSQSPVQAYLCIILSLGYKLFKQNIMNHTHTYTYAYLESL